MAFWGDVAATLVRAQKLWQGEGVRLGTTTLYNHPWFFVGDCFLESAAALNKTCVKSPKSRHLSLRPPGDPVLCLAEIRQEFLAKAGILSSIISDTYIEVAQPTLRPGSAKRAPQKVRCIQCQQWPLLSWACFIHNLVSVSLKCLMKVSYSRCVSKCFKSAEFLGCLGVC